MKKREDIVQKFSSFLSFPDYNSSRKAVWQADVQLENNMKLLVQLDPEAKAEFWARHFLKILRDVPQSEKINEYIPKPEAFCLKTTRHLSAYLQEACIWAAENLYQKFHFLRHKYPLEEYFQIAASVANVPVKLFKNFNLERPISNIEGYARTALMRFVRDKIYQQDIEAKRIKFSDYGLLKDLSNKEIKEALASKGITQLQIDLHRLAWQCFDEIYQPYKRVSDRRLEPPDRQYLELIANCCNQRIHNLNLPAEPVSEDKIKQMLQTCIQAARDYRTKTFLPLEEKCETMSASMLTPWDKIVQEEEREEVRLLIANLFETIPEAGQTMLKLWLGLNFSQTEIAAVMKNKYPELQKQYQVARHLGKYTKKLLKAFIIECNKMNPEACLNDEKDIERIKVALDECLQCHCQKLVYSLLSEIQHQNREERKMLTDDRLKKPDRQSSKSEPQMKDAKQDLTENFLIKLEQDLNISVDSPIAVRESLAKFVEDLLQKQSLEVNIEGNKNDPKFKYE